MANEIKITCKGADVLPIDKLVDFQGDLKKITDENLGKLKRRIVKHGINAPVFIWDNGEKYILDGHQRIKALNALIQEGFAIPLIPVVYIEADNEEDAKEKLLGITSQYGEFDTEGFLGFTEGISFSFEDIRLTDGAFYTEQITEVDIDDFFTEDSGEQEAGKEKKLCPHCGQPMP